MNAHVLAFDQGTTSTRAVVFDRQGVAVASARRELPQIFPRPGWVEHDPEEIWRATVAVGREALAAAGLEARAIAAVGITNQRETTVLWERASGRPLANAIVWQDRRTAAHCQRLVAQGHEREIQARTGLVVDAYFSASKLAWLLDQVPGARAAAGRDDLCFGTIDTFLLWRLSGGRAHATDASNASRTMLYDIHRGCWDDRLLELFGIPASVLPEVRDNACAFATCDPALFGAPMPITGMAGDQQAAALGQACTRPGMIKSTYGTGCFVLLNTGAEAVVSRHRLLTTVAWQLGGRRAYALEGSIFNAGSTVQWLRDRLRLIGSAAESEALAAGLDGNAGVHLVPAFTGLGAPWWDSEARGAIIGLTRDSGAAEIVRAALEAVAYQTRDLLAAMAADGVPPSALRVDGGMTANGWLMQFLADQLGVAVDLPQSPETTVWGAAWLAGMQVGLYPGLDQLDGMWRRARTFEPRMPAAERDALHAGWLGAVARARSAGA